METNSCVICGGSVALGRAVDVISIAGRKTSVEVEGYRCASCGEVFLTPDQADAAQRLAASVLRKEEGLLTPEEIRTIRGRLGLTQVGLERLLGVGPKTVVRWERGTVFQSAPVDRLLRIVAEFPDAAMILTRLNLHEPPGARLYRSPQKVVQISDWRKEQRVNFTAPAHVPLPEIPVEAMR